MGRYARLRRWYGMRKAAAGWEEDYADKLKSAGFTRGVAAPTVFWDKETDVHLVVHGDDFTFTGTNAELNKVEKWYDVKVRGRLGNDADDTKEITVLGRTLRWTEDGFEYE